MARIDISGTLLLVLLTLLPAGAAFAQSTGDGAPGSPPPPSVVPAPPPAPPDSPPAAPAQEPAGPAPAPSPPPVQTFEPAEVGAPKEPVSPEPARTSPGALPLTMDEMPVAAASNRVSLNMFGDTAFAVDSVTPRQPGFVIGDLDLLITGHAADITAMAETAFEQHGHGDIGIDLERIFVDWRGDRVSLDAGRTHAELGYWNNAFHHGRWLQMSVERPRILRFEDDGGILPIHLVGVTGHWRALVDGDQQIELIGSAGNGRGDIVDDVQTTFDSNAFKALLFKVGFRGFGARDLQFGISGMYDHVAPLPLMAEAGADDPHGRPALPGQTIQELIGNAYLAYRGPDFTFISEVFDLFHTAAAPDAAGVSSWNTVDAYALGAYRIDQVSPYLMGEIRRMSNDPDPFFFPGDPAFPSVVLGNFVEVTAGLRWDFATWSAIKVEYRGTLTSDSTQRIHVGTVDWCFGL